MRPEDAVAAFNAAINRQDIDALASLMTDDHEFVDTTGTVERGKAHCLDLWRGFFAQFPDYRNTFTRVSANNNEVVIVGYSTCSVKELDGPALWKAVIVNDNVAHWRVYDDTPENRLTLGVSTPIATSRKRTERTG
jgi:ketosteroid isomerase-like protein